MYSKIKIGWAVVVVFLIFATNLVAMPSQSTRAAAATLYADGNLSGDCLSGNYSVANRSCSGSDGNAYGRVVDALAAVSNAGGTLDGSTISVRSGTYREATFLISRALTLTAYNGEGVTLTYNPANPPREDGEYAQIMIVDASNVTIEGFTVRGTRPLGDNATTDYDIDIAINDGISNTTIRNNRIYDGGHAGVKSSNRTGSFVVENNEFDNIGFTLRDHGIYSPSNSVGAKIIRYNDFHNITGWGVHIYNYGTNHQVYGNVIHHNGGGIVVTGDHNLFFNNVIANNGPYGGLVFFHYGLTDISVKNNIMWHNTGGDIVCSADNAGAGGRSFANNIVGTGSGNCPYWDTAAVNTITADPLFVSGSPSTAADYKVQNTSPAVNAGVNLGGPYNMELDQASGGAPFALADENAFGAWEIGAFVSGSGLAPVAPAATAANAAAPQATPLPARGAVGTATARGVLNVRSQPNSNSAALGYVPSGATINLIGRDATTNWLKMNYNGLVGWVATFYVNITPADVHNLLVVQ